MARHLSPKSVIVLGFVLVMLGFVLAFLMTMQVLQVTFLLAFISYITSFGGLLLGIIGAAWFTREGRY